MIRPARGPPPFEKKGADPAASRGCATLYRIHHPEASLDEVRRLLAEWIDHHVVRGDRGPTPGRECDREPVQGARRIGPAVPRRTRRSLNPMHSPRCKGTEATTFLSSTTCPSPVLDRRALEQTPSTPDAAGRTRP